MGRILIEKLNPHPKNGYYFSDVEGEKYEEIKRSIATYGIRDPIKVTTNYTIISGHQRYRIAKDLEMVEVPVEIVDKNEWEAEYLLIAENVERRGQAEGDPIRKGRIAQFLKEYWGVRQGGDRSSGQNDHLKTRQDIADAIGEDDRTTRRLLKLNDLIPPLQALVSNGKLGTTAAEQLAYLTIEEQQALFDERGERVVGITVNESKELRVEIEGLREENSKLSDELQKEREKQLSTIEVHIDNTDYELVNRLEVDLKKEKLDKETLKNKLLQLESKKYLLEEDLKKAKAFLSSEEAEIKQLELQKEKLELQAHISISELQIGIHKFIEDYAPSVFLQGAVASSTFMMRDDLLDSVISLEEFTQKLREMLSSKIEIVQNGKSERQEVNKIKKLN